MFRSFSLCWWQRSTFSFQQPLCIVSGSHCCPTYVTCTSHFDCCHWRLSTVCCSVLMSLVGYICRGTVTQRGHPCPLFIPMYVCMSVCSTRPSHWRTNYKRQPTTNTGRGILVYHNMPILSALPTITACIPLALLRSV